MSRPTETEQMLEQLALGEKSVDDEDIRQRMQEDPEFRADVEQQQLLLATLNDTVMEQRVLEQLHQPAPGEDQILTSFASALSDRPPEASSRQRGGLMRFLPWVALAAAAVLVAALIWPDGPAPEPNPTDPDPNAILGNEEILEMEIDREGSAEGITLRWRLAHPDRLIELMIQAPDGSILVDEQLAPGTHQFELPSSIPLPATWTLRIPDGRSSLSTRTLVIEPPSK